MKGRKAIFFRGSDHHASFMYHLSSNEKNLWNKIGNKKFTGLLYPEKMIHKADSVKNAYKNSIINVLKSIIEWISNAVHLNK